MIRNKLESLQKSRKKRYLSDISNTTEEAVNFGVEIDEPQAMITSDNVEQQTLNEAELSTVTFERGKTNFGGDCLWLNGFRFTHHSGNRWRCTNRSCSAYANITNNGETGATGTLSQKEHNHLPAPQKQQAESKRQKIKESVLAEPCLKPTRLLSKVRRSATDEAFVAMSSNNALTEMMRREKKKLLGNVDVQDPLAFVIPATLREKRGEDIVLYDSRNVRQGEKDVVLIFGSVKTLEILRQCGTWHLDGTFKCAPSMWEQCFVIGASVHHRMCICMWCLLPGKQRRYYEEALNFLRGRTSPVVPGKVLCDFEKAEMAAIRAVFPTAQIKCCMFHYGQSLYRNFKRLGLVHLYGEKTEYGEAVRNTFRRVLSLPLLPPDIIRRAFSIIVASSPPGMQVFFLYFSRTYIGLTQRQLLDGVNAFGDNRLNFSPIGNHSSLGTTISTINSEHSYAATPVQFGIGSPAPSTLTWPTTVSPREQIVQYSLSPLSTSTAPSAWEDEIVRAPHFSIPMWNMHSQATSALARTNNGLEATHLHFMKGLCHHPALSDFICGVNESIDRQVDAARSARHFIHKRHKRYILQDAVIMRILADASYNNNGDIHDLMTALGLQVEGYAGKLKDFENFDDSIVHLSHQTEEVITRGGIMEKIIYFKLFQIVLILAFIWQLISLRQFCGTFVDPKTFLFDMRARHCKRYRLIGKDSTIDEFISMFNKLYNKILMNNTRGHQIEEQHHQFFDEFAATLHPAGRYCIQITITPFYWFFDWIGMLDRSTANHVPLFLFSKLFTYALLLLAALCHDIRQMLRSMEEYEFLAYPRAFGFAFCWCCTAVDSFKLLVNWTDFWTCFNFQADQTNVPLVTLVLCIVMVCSYVFEIVLHKFVLNDHRSLLLLHRSQQTEEVVTRGFSMEKIVYFKLFQIVLILAFIWQLISLHQFCGTFVDPKTFLYGIRASNCKRFMLIGRDSETGEFGAVYNRWHNQFLMNSTSTNGQQIDEQKCQFFDEFVVTLPPAGRYCIPITITPFYWFFDWIGMLDSSNTLNNVALFHLSKLFAGALVSLGDLCKGTMEMVRSMDEYEFSANSRAFAFAFGWCFNGVESVKLLLYWPDFWTCANFRADHTNVPLVTLVISVVMVCSSFSESFFIYSLRQKRKNGSAIE
ncbi:hypothetical protein niasHT_002659 [Heterodera trifolii]|uniref:MULE transposase domain-containing protein n=1 Tax=Heterodera trifolii TaxID=157864 RepID=A0ABD2MBM8_9BILA